MVAILRNGLQEHNLKSISVNTTHKFQSTAYVILVLKWHRFLKWTISFIWFDKWFSLKNKGGIYISHWFEFQ